MKFIQLSLNKNNKNYFYGDISDTEMNILGLFLMDDVGSYTSFYKNLFLNNEHNGATGNVIELEKKGKYVLLKDMYSEEKIPTTLKITYPQYLQILDDWEEKVIKKKPKEVTIKYENDQFIFETKD